MATSITQILKIARQAVSFYGQGTSWTVLSPYISSEPEGPYTSWSADGYEKARSAASRTKCRVALAVAGVECFDDDDFAILQACEEMMADGWAWADVATAMIRHHRGQPHGITDKRAARWIERSVKPAASV